MARKPSMSLQERAARQFLTDMRTLAPMIAEAKSPVSGAVAATPEDERRAYWTMPPDLDPEQVWAEHMTPLLVQGVPWDEARELARPTVALTLYPFRQKLIQAGTRYRDISAQIAYDKRLAAAGPPDDMEPTNG